MHQEGVLQESGWRRGNMMRPRYYVPREKAAHETIGIEGINAPTRPYQSVEK